MFRKSNSDRRKRPGNLLNKHTVAVPGLWHIQNGSFSTSCRILCNDITNWGRQYSSVQSNWPLEIDFTWNGEASWRHQWQLQTSWRPAVVVIYCCCCRNGIGVSKDQRRSILLSCIMPSYFPPRSDYLGSQLLPGCLATCRLPSSLLCASHISFWLFFDKYAPSEIQSICCNPHFKHMILL